MCGHQAQVNTRWKSKTVQSQPFPIDTFTMSNQKTSLRAGGDRLDIKAEGKVC